LHNRDHSDTSIPLPTIGPSGSKVLFFFYPFFDGLNFAPKILGGLYLAILITRFV
jgi:hypothetical protein